MSDFINKVVTIILIFVLLVMAPLANKYMSDYAMAKREILNDTSSFIDKAVDDKTITGDDLNKFYGQCNSHGLAVDVTVTKLIRTVVPDITTNDTTTVYYSTDVASDIAHSTATVKEESFNSNDIVKVSIQEVGISTARRVIYNITKIDTGKFELDLAGGVK